jgi:(p)ppGpp synthase/HD superfamily hydrolase
MKKTRVYLQYIKFCYNNKNLKQLHMHTATLKEKPFLENRETFQTRIVGLSQTQRMLIDFAYDMAKESHRPQLRDDGGRYFEHTREVPIIIMDETGLIHSGIIIEGLLHDSPEDSPLFANRTLPFSVWKKTAYFRLSRNFGGTVANNIIALTKPIPDGVEIFTKEQADKIYMLGLEFGGPRVMLNKAADRLHNLRTLPATTLEKQQKIIKETEEKYIPLFEGTAHLLPFQNERAILLRKIKDQVEVVKSKWS